jgi:hypothetical protein
MERQGWLKLETAEERAESLHKYLRPFEMAQRQVAVLCTIAGLGELIQVQGRPGSRLAIAKGELAAASKRCGVPVSGTTWMAGAAELQRKTLLDIMLQTRPWTYLVCWSRLAKLQPPGPVQPLETLTVFSDAPLPAGPDRTAVRSGPVRSGQDPRVREIVDTKNPCPETVNVKRDTWPTGLADRLRRPWHRRDGVTSQDLVLGVVGGELEILRRLYREAKVLEWIGDSEDELLRFLTGCHHVATSPGLGNRVGALVARLKRACDVHGCRQESENWAAGVLRARHRDSALANDPAG